MTAELLATPPSGSAIISPCARYRYLLTRRVGPQHVTATFIMLNPSSADATTDDPTICKCVGFCKRRGYGTLQVVNLFAVRATDPADIKAADDPVGPENAAWVERALGVSARDPYRHGPVVCAWGVRGAYMDQDLTVLGWLDRLGVQPVSLGVTKDGHPRHPLYVPYTARLTPFAGRSD
jgi:hypothetical protein